MRCPRKKRFAWKEKYLPFSCSFFGEGGLKIAFNNWSTDFKYLLKYMWTIFILWLINIKTLDTSDPLISQFIYFSHPPIYEATVLQICSTAIKLRLVSNRLNRLWFCLECTEHWTDVSANFCLPKRIWNSKESCNILNSLLSENQIVTYELAS